MNHNAGDRGEMEESKGEETGGHKSLTMVIADGKRKKTADEVLTLLDKIVFRNFSEQD